MQFVFLLALLSASQPAMGLGTATAEDTLWLQLRGDEPSTSESDSATTEVEQANEDDAAASKPMKLEDTLALYNAKPAEQGRAEEQPALTEAEVTDAKVEASKNFVDSTVREMREATDDSKAHFTGTSDKIVEAAHRLGEDFVKQHSAITELSKQTKYLEEKRREERKATLEKLEEFKNRTIAKFSDLETKDRRLGKKNSDLKAANEVLTAKITSEKKKKEAVSQELQRMAKLFREQSAQVQDLISKRKQQLETEVESTLRDAIDGASLAQSDAKVKERSAVETTTLVLR